MKMTAAVLDGPGRPFGIEEVDLASPRHHEVLIRVAATGLCASDLNALDGKRTSTPFPSILGHETAGVVVDTGPEVDRLRVGDHVVVSIVPSCSACRYCRRGQPNHCRTAGDASSAGSLLDGTSRLSARAGRLNHFLLVSGFAEYAVVPESGAVAIDPAMPLDRAALISCAVLTGVGAVQNTARVQPGQSVAVFGCGGVGLNVVQGARMASAEPIIAVDVSAEKLAVAQAVGATHLVHALEDDAVVTVRDLTDGGVDYAFEAVGRQHTIRQAWAAAAIGGTVIVVGLLGSGEQLTIDSGPLLEEKKIAGCYFGSSSVPDDVPALVKRYLAGELLLDELISRRIGLADLDDAFHRLRNGEDVRQVVTFDDPVGTQTRDSEARSAK